MAGAIISGILRGGLASPEEIIGSAPSEEGRAKAEKANGILVTPDNRRVCQEADVVFLSVKPQFLAEVAAEVKDLLPADKLVISIVAGRSLADLQDLLGGSPRKLIRVMPNTPALVGEGMSAFCCSEQVTEEEKAQAIRVLDAFGKSALVPERLFDAVTAVSGSSPAYVFLFIEAMADGAVSCGMPRAQAYQFAAQSVLGAAKMVLETGLHPGELKDMVTSPAGTTIEAVRVLEEMGLRSAVMEAVVACCERSKEL